MARKRLRSFFLPDIVRDSCVSFMACGVSGKKSRRSSKANADILTGKYVRRKQTIFFRLLVSDEHLHLNLQHAGLFKAKPRVTSTLSGLEERIRGFAGRKVRFRCAGLFVLPLADIQESAFFKALMQRTVISTDHSVLLKGADLYAGDKLVGTFGWRRLKEEAVAFDISLPAVTIEVGPSYPNDLLSALVKARRFVFDEGA